jgi:hypothetical protein
MCRMFKGNMFSRNVAELTREGTGASQDDTKSRTYYIQAPRYDSNPRSRI